MIERVAEKMAKSIYNHTQDSSVSVNILQYGLIIVIDFFLIVTLSLGLGAATGKFGETALGMACFVVLRAISGGYHLTTSVSCIILSTIISVSLPHIPLNDIMRIVLTIISILLFIIYSPSNLQNQSRIPEKYYPTLKVVSSLLVIGSLFIHSEIVALAIFIQAISLIRFSFSLKEVKTQ